MDIGTAKLGLSERRGVPHHQLDVLDVTEEASVAAYQEQSRADIADIRARGLHPILVGGSGLYVRAAVDRLEIPPTDPEVRLRIEGEVARHGAAAAHARLRRLDPVAARAIESGNARRIVRALEVIELTGRPFSATMPAREHLLPTVMIGLRIPRDVLDERITARVDGMWRSGLVDEVRRLDALGLREGRTASRALGYSQALAEIDGEMTRQQAQDTTAVATRRFARRQESWFRPDPRIHWLDPREPDIVEQAVRVVEQTISDNGTHD